VLKREIVSLPVTTWIVSECVCCYKMSQPSKRRRFLQSSKIAELFLDTDSDDATVSSDASSVEGGLEGVPRVSHTQPYRQTASSPKSSSSISSSASDEDEAVESGPDEQTQQAVTLQWTHPSCPQSSVAHTYTGGPRGKKDNEASHINDSYSPLNIFLLYFAEIITLLVVETNCYYQNLTKEPLLNLTLLKPKCLCFWH